MGLVSSCVRQEEEGRRDERKPGLGAQQGRLVENFRGPLDLIALLQQSHNDETTSHAALELAALEVQLAHNSHAILVVQPTKVAAAVAHPPPGDGYLDKATSKSARHVATADMSAYVSVVRRLQQVAAPARDSKAGTDSIAQLEALKKKQAFGHTGMHEHQTRLALLYANAVAHKVLGGAEGIRSWVDVHISRNPMLLSQLKGSKHEVYNHYIPAQQVKGELLQLDVVLCHVSKEQEAGPALVIGLHLQERDMEPNEVPVQASLQPRVQQQQHAQKVGMRRARFRGSKSLDLTHAGQLRRPGLNSEDVSMGGSTSTQQQQQQHQQQHLYLALSHLPVAVTLISSCGCITWQNGRSAELLGLRSGARREACQSLQHMFMLDPEALESLLLALKKGEAWNGLVQVPGREDMEQFAVDNATKVDTVAGGNETLAGSEGHSKREGHANQACCDGSCSRKRACPDVSLASASSNRTQKQEPDSAPQGLGMGPKGPPGGPDASERPSVFSFPEFFAGQASEPQSSGLPSAILPVFGFPAEAARDGSERSPSLQNDDQSAGSGRSGIKKQAMPAKAEERISLPASSGPSSLRAKSCILPPRPGRVQNGEPLGPSSMRTSSCVFPAQMQLGQRPSGLVPPQGMIVGSTSQIPDCALKDGLGEAPVLHNRQAAGRDGATFPHRDKSTLPMGLRHGRRRSVHTSGALIVQNQVCSGASRALKMSSSNAQIPAPISPRFDKSSVGVETCSLNWLAQGNVGTEASISSGTYSQPSHYFESIPEGRSKEAPNSQVDQSNGKLLETIVNSKAVDHTSLGVAVASSQPLPMPSKTQTGNLPPLQLKNLSASARDVKTTGSGSKHSVGFVEDVTSKPAAGDREWPTWSSCQVDEVPAIVALSPPSKGPCQPMGPAAPPTPPADAPLDAKASVHSMVQEESIMAHEHSWHYIDAFTIKGPEGEELTVLTNQDVTSLVETEISLKQILDIEHKILEDIYPKHVLEGQVAAGASMAGASLPICSSRRQSSGSHLSSATAGRVPSIPNLHLKEDRGVDDLSPTWTENCIGIRSAEHNRGKQFESGTSSPLPKSLSTEYSRQFIRNDMLPVQESSHSHQLFSADTGSHDTRGDGRVHSLMTAPSAPTSQGHNSCKHEGVLASEAAGLLRTRHSEGLSLNQGPGSSATDAPPERANLQEGNNKKDVAKGPLGKVRAPPRRNQSCSTVLQTSSSKNSGLQLPFDYGAGPNSLARSSLARKPTLSGMGRHHDNVTVMFVDIKNFTAMSRAISSAEVMHFLHTLFSRFDALIDSKEELGLYKVETIGGVLQIVTHCNLQLV